MVEITGRVLNGPTGLCLWCGRPAMETGFAPGLGREVPLHPTCAAAIIYAYRRWRLGLPFRSERQERRALATWGPRQLPATTASTEDPNDGPNP